jgi:quercetin dioxygenase-like cupin family protein
VSAVTAADAAAYRWEDLTEHAPIAGIRGSVRSGTQLSSAIFHLDPGAVVPLHRHVAEEFGQVLSGTLELQVADTTSNLAAGEAFLIPGDELHAAVAGPEGCVLLECYAPPRNPFLPQDPGESA